MQESTLKSIFESFIMSVNHRVDDLVKTVAEVKSSLEYTQRDVDDIGQMAAKLKDAEEEIAFSVDSCMESICFRIARVTYSSHSVPSTSAPESDFEALFEASWLFRGDVVVVDFLGRVISNR